MNTPSLTTTQLLPGRRLILGRRIVVRTLTTAWRHCLYRGKLTRFELIWPMQGTVEILPGQTIGSHPVALLTPGRAYLHATGKEAGRSLQVRFGIKHCPAAWGEPGEWPTLIDLPEGDVCRPLLGPWPLPRCPRLAGPAATAAVAGWGWKNGLNMIDFAPAARDHFRGHQCFR